MKVPVTRFHEIAKIYKLNVSCQKQKLSNTYFGIIMYEFRINHTYRTYC